MILENPPKKGSMNTDTYMIMKGNKVLGYIEAYSTYHALRWAEKMYGRNLIVERISFKLKATRQQNGVEAQ